MVCHCSVPGDLPQPDTGVLHPATSPQPAKAMTPLGRRQLALEALAGTETISGLAGQHAVSRKFVYRQAATAEEALDAAFSPADRDDQKVLFHLPVTKAWLQQLILGLTLTCHSSQRGVAELQEQGFQPEATIADVATLLTWLREDVFSVAGPDHTTRRELFDFLVDELRLREPLCPHRIRPVARALANQGDDLLAFASQLDRDLRSLAAEFQVAVETARAVLNVELLPPDDPSRWPREAALRSQLGSRHFSLRVATAEVARQTVRASSLVENCG